jgi:hypothetical protein
VLWRRNPTDPDLAADWSKYSSSDALQSRYAILEAMRPDIFYAMPGYRGIQDLEDVVLKLAGTSRCAESAIFAAQQPDQ